MMLPFCICVFLHCPTVLDLYCGNNPGTRFWAKIDADALMNSGQGSEVTAFLQT
jgi:hypothetical protein